MNTWDSMTSWISALFIILGLTAGNFLFTRYFGAPPNYMEAARGSFDNAFGIIVYLLLARK